MSSEQNPDLTPPPTEDAGDIAMAHSPRTALNRSL